MIPLIVVRLAFFFYAKAPDLPAKNSDGGPSVRRDDLPHYALEFEQSIGDVEDSQEPRIFIPCKMKVVFHACDFCISDITPVQRSQYIYYSSELLAEHCIARHHSATGSHKNPRSTGTRQSIFLNIRFSTAGSI